MPSARQPVALLHFVLSVHWPLPNVDPALLSAGLWHLSSQMALVNVQEAVRRVPDCGHQKMRRAASNLTHSLMKPERRCHFWERQQTFKANKEK